MSAEEYNKIVPHPTPRTDKEFSRIVIEVGDGHAGLADMRYFARTLERELIAAQNQIETLKARLARVTDE